MLTVFANLLAAALALAGGAFYVLVYTLWLKRTTPQNIVIGGAAGAIPPLAGWAAANGRIGVGAAYLFLIVLLWTPPHFWALSLLLARNYAAADVPMMPVVRGAAATARQILVVLGRAARGHAGPRGGRDLRGRLPGGRGAAGIRALRACAALEKGDRSRQRRAALFHFSLLYLALLFVAVAVDAAVR